MDLIYSGQLLFSYKVTKGHIHNISFSLLVRNVPDKLELH